MKDLLAFQELIDFVKHRIPGKYREEFWILARRAQDACTDSKLESTAQIIDGSNRYTRLRGKYEKAMDIVGQISEVCLEHRVEAVRPHFRTLGRVFREFDAPFPTQDEIRADIVREAGENIAKRNLHDHLAPEERSR